MKVKNGGILGVNQVSYSQSKNGIGLAQLLRQAYSTTASLACLHSFCILCFSHFGSGHQAEETIQETRWSGAVLWGQCGGNRQQQRRNERWALLFPKPIVHVAARTVKMQFVNLKLSVLVNWLWWFASALSRSWMVWCLNAVLTEHKCTVPRRALHIWKQLASCHTTR